ncbi:bacteriohemerythrin [Clostridium brassicae]|uniref:Bacteriohemerythrin n=1 Tax=Clostridium brassicae TaxID=2999072 RepID=A0ABT4DAT2_9CLOT|nr:bacteriohemerythrin [Clostridium brassicae]MCY6959412.1 bacteriohemerythrin [Clostridium brassicae]
MIKWKDEFLTGIELIDNQHKKLFEIANRAYKLLKSDFFTDKYDRILEILEELKSYTKYHFKSEEEYMMSINYKKFFSQKMEHDAFIKKLDEVNLKDLDENQDKYLMDILEFIVDWIVNHILGKDKLINAE